MPKEKIKIEFKGKTKTIIIIVVFLLIILSIMLPLINKFYSQKAGRGTLFSVKAGDGTRLIATNLKKESLISSAWLFSATVYVNHWALQSGVYSIKKDMNLHDIASLIHSGKVEEYLVTIPEGYRATQIDELLVKKNMIKKGDFTQIAAENEGQLFPDTYNFTAETTAQDVMVKMLENYKKKTKDLNITSQNLILASIVEREARLDQDRAKIAGVYFNRLAIGMKLDADPTIQYGKGSWAPITKSDYKSFQSPYNTYLHVGLPPTPICNPGIKSIQAVLKPEKNDYFYFFHKASGEAVFSKTYAEHLANLEKNQ